MFIGNKQMIMYPLNGILVCSKKEQTINTHNMDKSQKYYAKQKKSHMLHGQFVSNYTTAKSNL